MTFIGTEGLIDKIQADPTLKRQNSAAGAAKTAKNPAEIAGKNNDSNVNKDSELHTCTYAATGNNNTETTKNGVFDHILTIN